MGEKDLAENLIVSSPDYPPDIYKWIKLNAAPKMELKLMKVCKFFQHKNGFEYLVVKSVESCGHIWTYYTLDGQRHSTEKIEDIFKKFWITEKIDLIITENVASILLLKTVVCNIRRLKLDNQVITFNEFKMLTDGGNVEICEMMQTIITGENNEIVPLEDIFECLPNVRKLVLSTVTSFRSLTELEAKISPKLEKFTLWISSENVFDLATFSTFMMKHQNINYTFWFCGFSSDEFVEEYGEMVDEIIDDWPNANMPPRFCVSNQSEAFHVMIKQFAFL